MSRLLLYLLICVLLCNGVTVKAQFSPILIEEQDNSIHLWGKKEVFYWTGDTTNYTVGRTLNDYVISAPYLSSYGQPNSLGFIPNPQLWLKFRVIKNTSLLKNWVLQNDYPMIEELYCYVVDDSTGKIARYSLKETIPGYQRDINVHQAAIPLDLAPFRPYTVYVHLVSGDAKKIDFRLTESTHFYTHYFDQLWLWILHIGFVISMILVQVVFLFVTRERNFFFYSLFLMGYLTVAVVGGYGVVDKWFWPHSQWIKSYSIVFATLLFNLLGSLFYISALNIKPSYPRLYQLLWTVNVTSIIGLYWLFKEDPPFTANEYACIIYIAFFVLVACACWISYRDGHESALYYFLGTLAYFFGTITVLLWTLNYLEPNIFVINAIHIGSMLEMSLFTWALAKQYRKTREDNEEVQRVLISTLKAQNKEISEALLQGQTLERKRVAADLHDSLGGTLSALRLMLSSLKSEKMSTNEQQIYESLVEMTHDAQQKLRFLSHNLHPADLERDGLVMSLEKLADKLNRNGKTKFDIEVNFNDRLNKHLEFELYNICLELFNNVIKHANATSCKLTLMNKTEQLYLEVLDNGVGINDNGSGMGLRNMQERISTLKGTWQIESPNTGARISAQIPLN